MLFYVNIKCIAAYFIVFLRHMYILSKKSVINIFVFIFKIEKYLKKELAVHQR